MANKKSWTKGDVFLLKNLDGQYSLGQVLGLEKRTLHSVACAFFDIRVSSVAEAQRSQLVQAHCVATMLVTPHLLDRGRWKVVCNQRILIGEQLYPYCGQLRSSNPTGVVVYDAEVAEDLLNAYHGLSVWDDWHLPDFLDRLLLPTVLRPKGVLLRSTNEKD